MGLRRLYVAALFALVFLPTSPAFALQPVDVSSDDERGPRVFNEADIFEAERACGGWDWGESFPPSAKCLLAMARIQAEEKNYAAALRSYQRSLMDVRAPLPADRRAEVERELAAMKAQVAEIAIRVNVDGANVYLDDIPVCAYAIETSCAGVSPLNQPEIVNPGRHKATATKKGCMTRTAYFSVGAREVTQVDVAPDCPVLAPRPNPWKLPAIVGWSTSGALLIAGAVTGGLALNGGESEQALPTTSIAFFIATGVLASASTFFTIKSSGWSRKDSRTVQGFDVRLSPVGAVGTF